MSIRVLDDLRDNLERASRASGRSVSEEMAWRVTLTFLMDTHIQDLRLITDGSLRLARRILRAVNAAAAQSLDWGKKDFKQTGVGFSFILEKDEAELFDRLRKKLLDVATEFIRDEAQRKIEADTENTQR